MRALSRDDFIESVGGTYHVALEDYATVEMTLETVDELPSAGRAEGSFRLEFRGPIEPVLPQAIYSFTKGDECHEIFIVPVGRGESGTLYEAIFN